MDSRINSFAFYFHLNSQSDQLDLDPKWLMFVILKILMPEWTAFQTKLRFYLAKHFLVQQYKVI